MATDLSSTFLQSAVPDFLRSSDFYLSLDDAEDEPITIPSECARFSLELNKCDFESDLRSLLATFRFWGVYPLHVAEFTSFVLTVPDKALCFAVLAEFEAEFAELTILKSVLEEETDGGALCLAISSGHFELVKAMAANNFVFSQPCLIVAAHCNRLDCLKLALSRGCTWIPRITSIAARQGHVQILQFAYENCLECADNVCEEAARAGHLSCLQYAYESGYKWPNKFVPLHNLAIALYARSVGAEWVNFSCCDAAKVGSVELLKYFHEGRDDYHYPISNKALLAAVWMGHTDCVRYLHSIGVAWTGSECEFAAYRGHRDTLRYLCESGCRCYQLTSWVCAIHDRFDCLQYLHEIGCPWDCTTPIHCTHQWADPSKGCPLCESQIILRYTTELLMEVVGDTSVPGMPHIQKPIMYLGTIHDDFDQTCSFGIAALCTYYAATQCLQYAYRQRCAWPDNPFLLPNAELVPIKYYLYTLCLPWSAETAANAAACKTATHLQFLHGRGCPWDEQTVINALILAPGGSPPESCDAQSTNDRPSDFLCLRYAVQHNCPYEIEVVRTIIAHNKSYRTSKSLREIFPWIEVGEREEEQRVSRKRLLYNTGAMLALGVAQVCVQNVLAYFGQK